MAVSTSSLPGWPSTSFSNVAQTWGPGDVVAGIRRSDRSLVSKSVCDALGIAPEDVVACPPLRGSLVAAAAVLDAASRDQGQLVTERPGAVLFPADGGDIAAIVRWCGDLGISVAARGTGHTCRGQSLVDGGVSIAMSSLRRVHRIDDGVMEVDAGIEWRQVVRAAAEHGQRPPSLTGYLDLTVGGVLSVGGISAIPTEGAVIDRVRALEVVTGTGEQTWCSGDELPDLFAAVLGGLGQVGIIVRAELELVAAPTSVRGYLFDLGDPAALFAAARGLLPDKADELYLRVMPPSSGTSSRFTLIACVYEYAQSEAGLVDQDLLRTLPDPIARAEHTWLGYVEEVTHMINGFRASGWDDRVKVWSDVFLPDDAVQQHVENTLKSLTWEEWGAPGTEEGFVLAFPHLRGRFTAPMLRLPDVPEDEYVWLFDVLSVSPDDPEPGYRERLLDRNDRLAAAARAKGGTVYPIGATRMSGEDWRLHYDSGWDIVVERKNKFDPSRVLTPGPQIFRPR